MIYWIIQKLSNLLKPTYFNIEDSNESIKKSSVNLDNFITHSGRFYTTKYPIVYELISMNEKEVVLSKLDGSKIHTLPIEKFKERFIEHKPPMVKFATFNDSNFK